MIDQKTTDIEFMTRAIQLARRGRTSPNPMVGAVVVNDGVVVGEGYHMRAGAPHAEIVALRAAGARKAGSTLYVSLEPCCHHGRTPPCTKAIIEAGVSTVVAAMVDPDPKVSGSGIAELRQAGIEVRVPVCEDAARELNQAYIKHRTTGLPFVILKSAMSLDGKIATHTGDSKWITGQRARSYVHRLRSQVDAIIVGGNTARTDNPILTARLPSSTHYPTRVVISRSGEIPSDLQLLREPGQVIVACSETADLSAMRKLGSAGAHILTLRETDGRLLVADLLKSLGKMDHLSVLVEGGGEVAAAALEERVVDKIVYFYSPRLIGGRNAVTAVGGIGVPSVSDAIRLENVMIRRLGEDIVIEARPVYPEHS